MPAPPPNRATEEGDADTRGTMVLALVLLNKVSFAVIVYVVLCNVVLVAFWGIDVPNGRLIEAELGDSNVLCDVYVSAIVPVTDAIVATDIVAVEVDNTFVARLVAEYCELTELGPLELAIVSTDERLALEDTESTELADVIWIKVDVSAKVAEDSTEAVVAAFWAMASIRALGWKGADPPVPTLAPGPVA